MKNSFKLHEHQEKKKLEEPSIPPVTCHICSKVVGGAYGWTELGDILAGSCSSRCESQMVILREKRHDAFPVRANQTT
jgi:hypothetical protein